MRRHQVTHRINQNKRFKCDEQIICVNYHFKLYFKSWTDGKVTGTINFYETILFPGGKMLKFKVVGHIITKSYAVHTISCNWCHQKKSNLIRKLLCTPVYLVFSSFVYRKQLKWKLHIGELEKLIHKRKHDIHLLIIQNNFIWRINNRNEFTRSGLMGWLVCKRWVILWWNSFHLNPSLNQITRLVYVCFFHTVCT